MTTIIKLDDSTYLVNGKPVFEDGNSRLISRTFELTPSEEQELHKFISEEKIKNYNSDTKA